MSYIRKLDGGGQGHVTLQESGARRLTNQPGIAGYKHGHLHRKTGGQMERDRRTISHMNLST